MILEGKHNYPDQIRIYINNTILRFSIYEFSIAIELNYTGNEDDFNYSNHPPCRFQRKYLSESSTNVKKRELVSYFENRK